MYKLDLPLDYKEAAAIERRRNQEAQRKSRIFNAKVRTIGIDKQGLEQQVHDRKQMEFMENRRDEAFHADAVRNDQIASLLERRQAHDMRELDCAVNEFRDLHQQPQGRREWDLYDPDGLKKDKPARVCDDDPRCGISGMQKLDGEDLNSKARRKFQQEQSREWFEEQAREKEQANQNQKRADRLYDLKAKELDERAMALQKAEEDCQRAVRHAADSYNNALNRERAAREALDKRQAEDDNATEMANNIYGDFLTENPAVAQSAFGPHRVVPDRWKGMSPEQVADIRRMQDIQRREMERLRNEEKRRDDEWDDQRVAQARAAEMLQRENDRREKDIAKQLANENQRLGSEQHSHKDYLYNEVYTNEPTAGYFMQFNTTTR